MDAKKNALDKEKIQHLETELSSAKKLLQSSLGLIEYVRKNLEREIK